MREKSRTPSFERRVSKSGVHVGQGGDARGVGTEAPPGLVLAEGKFASDIMDQPLKVLCELGGERPDGAHLLSARRRGPAQEGPGKPPQGSRLRSQTAGVNRRMWTPPGGQARIQNRVGGSLIRYCRMSGLLMRLLLAADPSGVREDPIQTGNAGCKPSANCWFFRSRSIDRLPLTPFLRPAPHFSRQLL